MVEQVGDKTASLGSNLLMPLGEELGSKALASQNEDYVDLAIRQASHLSSIKSDNPLAMLDEF